MIDQLLTVTDEVIALLQTEQHLLNGRKLVQAGELHDRKEELNNKYQLAVLQLKNQREKLESAPAAERTRLFLKTQEMKKLLQDNARLLEIVSSANDRLIKALVFQFSSQTPGVESYNRFGTHMNARNVKTAAMTVSKAV